jgi:hypothetical protein
VNHARDPGFGLASAWQRQRVAFERIHTMRFKSCFMHVVTAKALRTFARHALGSPLPDIIP